MSAGSTRRASLAAALDASARAAIGREPWAPVPPASDRGAWGRVSDRDRGALLAAAEHWRRAACAGGPTLSLWAHYGTTGERAPYEREQVALLNSVATAAMAACVEDEGADGADEGGRWLGVLADGVWRLCEMSAWCLPSHYALPEDGARPLLPIPGVHVLDLSAGYTGGMLAAVDRIVGDRVERVLPGIRARVHDEIRRRVIEPWEAHDWFWAGTDDEPPNNWAPWIVSNVLACAAVVDDRDALERTADRSLVLLDRFLSGYGPDGGCDEGATYFWWAGATLFEALDVLSEVTGGAFDGTGVDPVPAMGRFPMLMQISADRQVNFSDASAALPPNASWHLLARYGERTGDEELVRHARWMGERHPLGFDGQLAPTFLRVTRELLDPGWAAGDAAAGMPSAWFAPSIEVAVARSEAGVTAGWFVAAKGGRNDVSHNHNDAGGAIVSLDGEPVLIDVGVGTYRRETFLPDTRYTIWTMRSAWHSAPLPNGVEQRHGSAFRATGTAFAEDADGAELSMELRDAYPPEARLSSLRRRVALDRAASRVVIADEAAFEEDGVLSVVLMTNDEPVAEAGGLRIGAAIARIGDGVSARTERIPLDDARLSDVWGDAVFRTVLTRAEAAASARIEVVLERA